MKKIINSTIFIGCTFLAGNSFAQVSGMSPENLVQINKDAYWSTNVTCKNGKVQTIQRKTDGSEWCGKTVSGYCDTNKDKAAEKVCGADYADKVSSLEEADRKAKEEKARAAKAKEEAERAEQRRLAEARRVQQEQRIQAERARKAAEAAPARKQISIEEQLIQVEQEKLNLRRQELELEKRAVEIEKLLEKAS